MTPKLKIVNFGCRVNAAESNQFAQFLLNQKIIKPTIFVNTCAITQKGEYESLAKVRVLSQKYPHHQIIVSGCANLSKISHLPNVTIFPNYNKNQLSPKYTPKVKDKFSNSKKFILKVQSGCTTNCSYCIVPQKRPKLWSIPIDTAVDTVNTAIQNGYQHLIITGVNLAQYQPNLNNLLESLLSQTTIPFISFGSIPIPCVNDKFIKIIKNHQPRIKNFLHIPIQSGSDKILKLMHRPYNVKKIKETFNYLKNVFPPLPQGEVSEGRRGFDFGTDIIVGFPGETDQDFQQTYDLCQQIGFTKIHTFRFSPRPGTEAQKLHQQSPKISQETIKQRSRLIRETISQTKLPSHQTPES